MRPAIFTVAAMLAVVAVAGCALVTVVPTPPPSSGKAPASGSPVTRPSPSAHPGATSTPIGLDASFRPQGPWEVDFTIAGTQIVREIFVLTPACEGGRCDVNVVIQDFAGNRLGTGTFQHRDNVYVFESEMRTTEACSLSAEVVSLGVETTTTTSLMLAGYRPAGSAVVSPRIQGSRTVATRPLDANACAATSLTYSARGTPTKFAFVPPTPPPTPKPGSGPKVTVIKPTYFGSGVTISTFGVTGATPGEISRSIATEGPYMQWLGGSAAGVTEPRISFRFHGATDASGSCRIVLDARPAIQATFVIVLPRWTAPATVAASTITWWNADISAIAAHEKVHVDIIRAAVKKANSTLKTSSCGNVEARLQKVFDAATRDNCEFDMREYGTAAGLSLDACLAG